MTCKSSNISTNPAVSVIMSCFNASDYVAEAIESVFLQTFSDFELILIDDGSLDNTLDIIKKYALKDSRVVVIEKPNTGLTDSLNVGIRASRGKWIARLDADDIALPTRLEEQITFLKNHPDILLVGSDFIEIDQHGKVIKVNRYPKQHHRLLSNLTTMKRFFPHSSAMFRSDVISKIGGYKSIILCAEDWDLWLRLAEYGKIACLNKPLVKIRKHSQQVSHDKGGWTQALHGLAASVCHFLRENGAIDPSGRERTADWLLFIDWIALRIKRERYFEIQQEWSQIRNTFFYADNKVDGAWQMSKALVTSKNVFRILQYKFFGSYLPARLANEWVTKLKCME